MKELTNNSTSKKSNIDCQVFHHSQIAWKECLGQLWPTSVTFLPEITIVERLHHMFAVQHKIYERFPPQLMYQRTLGPEHILFYKDGKRVFSLVHEIEPMLWDRWETCHETSTGDQTFTTLEDAFKEILQTLYNSSNVVEKRKEKKQS